MLEENHVLDEIIIRISGDARSLFRARIAGRSMWPLIANGAVLGIRPGSRDIRKGDIILYRSSGRMIIHRVVRVEGEIFITKGDALAVFDPAIERKDIIGRAVFIEHSAKKRKIDTGIWRLLNYTIANYSWVLGTMLGSIVRKNSTTTSRRLIGSVNILFPMIIHMFTRRN